MSDNDEMTSTPDDPAAAFAERTRLMLEQLRSGARPSAPAPVQFDAAGGFEAALRRSGIDPADLTSTEAVLAAVEHLSDEFGPEGSPEDASSAVDGSESAETGEAESAVPPMLASTEFDPFVFPDPAQDLSAAPETAVFGEPGSAVTSEVGMDAFVAADAEQVADPVLRDMADGVTVQEAPFFAADDLVSDGRGFGDDETEGRDVAADGSFWDVAEALPFAPEHGGLDDSLVAVDDDATVVQSPDVPGFAGTGSDWTDGDVESYQDLAVGVTADSDGLEQEADAAGDATLAFESVGGDVFDAVVASTRQDALADEQGSGFAQAVTPDNVWDFYEQQAVEQWSGGAELELWEPDLKGIARLRAKWAARKAARRVRKADASVARGRSARSAAAAWDSPDAVRAVLVGTGDEPQSAPGVSGAVVDGSASMPEAAPTRDAASPAGSGVLQQPALTGETAPETTWDAAQEAAWVEPETAQDAAPESSWDADPEWDTPQQTAQDAPQTTWTAAHEPTWTPEPEATWTEPEAAQNAPQEPTWAAAPAEQVEDSVEDVVEDVVAEAAVPQLSDAERAELAARTAEQEREQAEREAERLRVLREQEAERARQAAEAERIRQQEEAERKRQAAEAEAERVRQQEEAERKRLEREAEKQRKAEEAAARRAELAAKREREQAEREEREIAKRAKKLGITLEQPAAEVDSDPFGAPAESVWDAAEQQAAEAVAEQVAEPARAPFYAPDAPVNAGPKLREPRVPGSTEYTDYDLPEPLPDQLYT